MKVREEVERLMNTKQKPVEENINIESKPIKTKPTKAKKPVHEIQKISSRVNAAKTALTVQEPLKQEYPQQPNDDLEPYMLYRNLFM
jgi:hypothetical protein